MERLIKDANEYGATIGDVSNLSINSFADIVKAIDLIQRKQGIAGTTAKEAMHTIEGAANATKAAWKNVITAIAGGGNLKQAFNGLITSIFGDGSEGSGLLANIIPRIQQTMEGIGEFISKASPYITKYLPELVESILPPLLESATSLVVSLAKALPKIIGIILETIPKLIRTIAQTIKKELPVIGGTLEFLADILDGLFSFIEDNKELVIAALTGIFTAFMAFKAVNFFNSITESITKLFSVILANPVVALIGVVIAGLTALGVMYYNQVNAVKSVEQATKDLEEAQRSLDDAYNSQANAIDNLHQKQEELKKLEEESGQSGKELYDQVEKGTLTYEAMNEVQKKVYKAYLDNEQALKKVKEAEEQVKEAKRETEKASLEQGLAIASETGKYDEWKNKVIEAWKQGKITTDDARQLFKDAAYDMDNTSRIYFTEGIPNEINGAAETIRPMWDANNPASAIYAIIDSFHAIGKASKEGFGETSEGSTGAFDETTSTWDIIGQWFEEKLAPVKAAFTIVSWWITTKLSEAKTWVTSIWENIGQWFTDRKNDITNAFESVSTWFSDKFEEAKRGVENIWNGIGGFFSGIWEDIKSAFDFSDAFNWGSDMINNFVDGLKKKWDELKQGVSDTAQIIANFFKHSTPKEGPLADDDIWTKHMMDNFIDGIDDNKNKLKKSITSVADMMAEPMTMNVDGVFNAKGNAFNENNKGGNVYNISFNQPVNSPVQMARKIREEAQYGLLGG